MNIILFFNYFLKIILIFISVSYDYIQFQAGFSKRFFLIDGVPQEFFKNFIELCENFHRILVL